MHQTHRREFGCSFSTGVLAVILGVAAPSAFGLTITATFDPTIATDPNALAIESTINQAIAVYQGTFSDPITVTIKFQKLTSATEIGHSDWWWYNIPYSTFRGRLASDATSANDAVALAHLPNVPTNPVTGNTSINVKTATIKALGISGSYPSQLSGGFDGIIGLNIPKTFPPAAQSGNYSLLMTTEHEIDEILGLASDLQSPGFGAPYVEDLYRYDAAGNRSFTTAGDNAYFSIDGSTRLARFNQNSGGDYGDWWSSGVHAPQVQDAFLTAGVTPSLGPELTALDVIGYNLTNTPEPGLAASLVTPFIAAIARRQRRTRPELHECRK
jgi:hypothetical protein